MFKTTASPASEFSCDDDVVDGMIGNLCDQVDTSFIQSFLFLV